MSDWLGEVCGRALPSCRRNSLALVRGGCQTNQIHLQSFKGELDYNKLDAKLEKALWQYFKEDI